MAVPLARGDLDAVDRRSDVYALGAVLYHLLAGRAPFTGESTVEVLVQILQAEPVPVRKLAPQIPADLETIVMKCLEKEPERRYRSARAVAAQREAEKLMDFMLEDLYERLEPLGRVDLLGEVARQSLRHYEDTARQDLHGLLPDAGPPPGV